MHNKKCSWMPPALPEYGNIRWDNVGCLDVRQIGVETKKKGILHRCYLSFPIPGFVGGGGIYNLEKDQPPSIYEGGMAGRIVNDPNVSMSCSFQKDFIQLSSRWLLLLNPNIIDRQGKRKKHIPIRLFNHYLVF